jgi:hypothetical protein
MSKAGNAEFYKEMSCINYLHMIKTSTGPTYDRENLYKNVVRFEVFTAVTMKNGVFWDVTPCSSCKNGLSGGT